MMFNIILKKYIFILIVLRILYNYNFISFAEEESLFNNAYDDVLSDDEYFSLLEKRSIKNIIRPYFGFHIPVPISMIYLYNKHLKVTTDEAIYSNLNDNIKDQYLIFDNIRNYNNNHQNNQIKDCIRFKDENVLNDYVAEYKIGQEDKICKPFLLTNILKSLFIKSKLDDYFYKDTECEFELNNLNEDDYLKKIEKYNEYITKKDEPGYLGIALNYVFNNNNNVENNNNNDNDEFKDKIKDYDDKAAHLTSTYLTKLKEKINKKKLLQHSSYEKIYKNIKYFNFTTGVSDTFYFNKTIGIDIDISTSFSYFDIKKSVLLEEFNDGKRTYVFEGSKIGGEARILPGLKDGNIINKKILQEQITKKAIENNKYIFVDNKNINTFGWNFFSGIANGFNFFSGGNEVDYAEDVKKLRYCANHCNDTKDVATNTFVSNKFLNNILDYSVFNVGINIKQLNFCFKTGLVIRLNHKDTFSKIYNRRLFHNSHQLIFNIGCFLNINFITFNLNFDIDQKTLNYEKSLVNPEEEKQGIEKKYKTIQEGYKYLNEENDFLKENVFKYIKTNEFIHKWMFRPMFEIKYRLDNVYHITFEIGVRFIFRSIFNLNIDKNNMIAYWSNGAEVNKYNDTTTEEELNSRRGRIIDKIQDFGIPLFLNFDVQFFFSIGFNFIT